MSTLTLQSPNAKQMVLFLDRHKYIGYGGARGGGKSWGARTKAVLLAEQYAGIKILIVRKTFNELKRNHIDPLRALLSNKYARYNSQDKIYTFPNGSTIEFGYCDADKDLDRYQGAEYDVIFLEEATQYMEIVFQVLKACIRGTNGLPKRIYLTFNPGGVGHSWVKRIFIDRKFKPDENPEEYSFIQSFVDDNTALMAAQPEYKAQLAALPEKLKRAWLYGDWNVFEGQFFEEFTDDPKGYDTHLFTHVIKPFPIPRDWPRFRSFDWGSSRPFSCGWWAVAPSGTLYRIAELYGCGREPNEGLKWPPNKVFAEIKRIEQESPLLKGLRVSGIADPAIWDGSRDENGVTIADMAARQGIYFEPGNHARIPGWMQVHYRLAFDEGGRPQLYIFNTCKDTIRTLTGLIYDDHKVEDLDTEGEDHIADEIRYMCMRNPIVPPKIAQAAPKPISPLDTDDDVRYISPYEFYAR
ncbi:MAG TPA: phage terminase large subunit [Candidatus Limiplasma sp.]|nr:phage terminase large subunit [Candidatus Limiplasma sp.]